MPGSQVYSALEKGVVDGAAWPSAGMLSMKHFEVAKYKVRPTFGTSTLPILINMGSWKKLSQAEKNILLSAGEMTELQMPWKGDALQAKEDAELAFDAFFEKYEAKYLQASECLRKDRAHFSRSTTSLPNTGAI